MATSGLAAALSLVFFLCTASASGSYPKAQNVTWKSTNFKTILTWEPKPSADYSYTVEYSVVGSDRQRNPHCFRTPATMCDLSSYLSDLRANYTAEVLSEPPRGASSDLHEFPSSPASRFCPYSDTDIGKPDFRLEVSEDKKKTTLYVTDPPTALYKDDDHQLNIRDIFSDDLQYLVTYRKNKSSGKKTYKYKNNVIELTDLDRGVSYCFNVQIYIPSRKPNKQLGEMSQTQCSEDNDESIFDTYSGIVIAGAIFLIMLIIAVIIAVTVVCWRRRNNLAKQERRHRVPQDV